MLVAVLRDEDGRVRIAPERAQVAALVGDAAPAVGRQQPAAVLAADGAAELDERLGVVGAGGSDRDGHRTIPWPPRRGSPAAAKVPSARSSTAETPPK